MCVRERERREKGGGGGGEREREREREREKCCQTDKSNTPNSPLQSVHDWSLQVKKEKKKKINHKLQLLTNPYFEYGFSVHRAISLLCLQNDIHVLGHDLPGGTMGTDDSAQAPIFNLHHAYVDYQWWRYLRSSAYHRASAKYFHDKRAPKPMVGTDWKNITGTKPGGIRASELLDSTKLGKTLRVSHNTMSDEG